MMSLRSELKCRMLFAIHQAWSSNKGYCTIKIYLKQTGCEGVEWMQLTHNRVQWQTHVKFWIS
jgi:hypothetical protein